MNCSACKCLLQPNSFLHCSLCNEEYHYACLNLKRAQYAALSNEYLASWVCPACSNVTRRTKSNCNTPVRRHQVPGNNVNESNTSFEGPDSNVVKSYILSGTSGNEAPPLASNDQVTMEKIGQILDQKLNLTLTHFMSSFRNAIKEDLKSMVENETSIAIQQLSSSFNDTITTITTGQEVIKSEQEKFRCNLEEQSSLIRSIVDENTRLKESLRKLNNRLEAMDKVSRTHNIEIQSVPESRNENLLALFKNLTDLLEVSIDDSSVRACRRIAKMDPTSSRPRNILITLSSPRQRDMILSAVHRFNKKHLNEPLNSRHLGIDGESRRLYVVEHLSPEAKILYAEARSFVKTSNYKYVWVRFGRVYVRKDDSSKAVFIKNSEVLKKLCP